uniref:Uncharacterized protein n=1 Tax=Rhizophora mucronata TaxID=61149 RepID=A0A2P2Q498_RHIMU
MMCAWMSKMDWLMSSDPENKMTRRSGACGDWGDDALTAALVVVGGSSNEVFLLPFSVG